MDFTHTSNTNLLTMNMTTTHEMKFQHVDSMTINTITIQSDINSLTISLTTPPTINNTEELTAITTRGNVQTPPKIKNGSIYYCKYNINTHYNYNTQNGHTNYYI